MEETSFAEVCSGVYSRVAITMQDDFAFNVLGTTKPSALVITHKSPYSSISPPPQILHNPLLRILPFNKRSIHGQAILIKVYYSLPCILFGWTIE